jgi:DNA-directed RNA polymerase specialized sigma24 family protein
MAESEGGMIPNEARLQPLRGDTSDEFQRAVAHFGTRLRRAAEKIARGDLDLAEDLYAAAVTQLWEHDPARFDEDDEAYLWTSMINQMLMARRGGTADPTRAPLALRFR